MRKILNWNKVHKSHLEGMSLKDIAEKLKMDELSVRRVFTAKRFKLSDKEDQKFHDAFNGPYQTKTLKEVAAMMGMSNVALRNNFRRLNLVRDNRQKNGIQFGGKLYTKDNRGRLRSTTEPQTSLKRDIWEFHNGRLRPGQHIYLKDKDENNCTIENMRLKETVCNYAE
jgi:hypothetical protein